MNRVFLKFILFLIFILISSIIYFSFIGFETKRYNDQIKNEVHKINENLDIVLNDVKIILDILNLQVKVSTNEPILKVNNKILRIENVKTQISINSLINKKFLLRDLEISSKSIDLVNLVSFVRLFNKSAELYVFQKLIKKGNIIADIKLEFDDNGNVINNYKVNGFVKDAQVSMLSFYEINRLNFNFIFKDENLELLDLEGDLNDVSFNSKKILAIKKNNEIIVEGEFNNKNLNLNENQINLLKIGRLIDLGIKNIRLDTQNNFSFKIDKRFKLRNFKINSKLKIDEIVIKKNYNLKNFFPNLNNDIRLLKHEVEIKYKNKDYFIKGEGDIFLQKKRDNLKYKIEGKNKEIKFDFLLELEKNPLIINFLNFEKNIQAKTILEIKGKSQAKNYLNIEKIFLQEKDNLIEVNNLEFDKNFKFKSLEKIKLKYIDNEERNNELNIKKDKKKYVVNGKYFNANSIIDSLINSKNKKKFGILDKSLSIIINVDEVFLDKFYSVKNLKGNISYNNKEITKANIFGFFSDNKKLAFTIKKVQKEKITTLFLDKAEPIVKRYKFIKGYEEGSLDFSSRNINGVSQSKVKIYDFKLKELPVLTKLLTLASLQGIADILSGEGIRFDEFEMNFQNKDDLMTINEIFAIGPAISVLMSGYIEKDKLISLRGTLVPATTINKAIGSIPVLGKILVGSKTGEGVFGVSFKIKGPPKNLDTTVNPIKTLTPRFITRTLEKIKKN